MDEKYSVESYFGADFNGHPVGLEDSFQTDDWSKVEEMAHEKLGGGSHIKITNHETGMSIEVRPDEYEEDFEGEFPYKPQDLESPEAEKEGKSMEWQNYGDIGYLDEGGVQVRETDREGSFDVVLLTQHPEDENKMFAGHTTIDLDDYRDDDGILEAAAESFNGELTDAQLAAVVAENKGLVELSMTAFNENGAQAGYAMSYSAYEVDKLTLARGLQEMGIDVHDRLIELTQEAEQNEQNYRLLGRLQADCKYVLDTCMGENGMSLENSEKHLWAKTFEEQIEKMRELYEEVPEKPEWLTEAEIDSYERRFQDASDRANGYPTREEAIQYALNQGTGIADYSPSSTQTSEELETAETTQAERDAAEKAGVNPREVLKETVDYFYEGAKEEETILYAMQHDLSLLDLDEWQAINEVTGIQLTWEDARTINNILYESHDLSPLDIEVKADAKTVKEAMDGVLTPSQEADIYVNVLSKYDDVNHLEPTRNAHDIADEIEQFMFERGEYDFGDGDRIRWIENIPEPYELAASQDVLDKARSDVWLNIESSMKTGTGIEALENYLKDQSAEMDRDDELMDKVKPLLAALDDYREHSLNEYMQARNAEELEAAKGTFTHEDAEMLAENFDIVPMYEHLDKTYDNEGYELADALSTEDVVKAIPDRDDDRWDVNEDELNEVADEAAYEAIKYLEEIEPMIAVDKDGNEAVLPLFKTEDGAILTAAELDDAVGKLIPDELPITYYGDVHDKDWYSPLEIEESEGLATIESDFIPSDFMMKQARENIDAVKDEYQRGKDAELAYDMIESVNCSVRENAAGTYDVIDNTDNTYRGIDCKNLSEVIASIDTLVDSALLDYMSSELLHSDDYDRHGEGVEIPSTAEEWVNFAENYPDFKEFAEGHSAELSEIALLADPDRLEKASISDVANTFYPEDKAYAAYQIQEMMHDDNNIVIHGDSYKLEKLPEIDDNGNPAWSYSSTYHLELNKEAGTFTVIDTDDLRDAKTQEMSETLVDFLEAKGMEIDEVERHGYMQYVLFDKEVGDYRKYDNGEPQTMWSAESVMENVGAMVEEVQATLEDAFQETFEGTDKEMPETPSEWTSFAGRPENQEFAKDYKTELAVMELAHKPEQANIKKAYDIQNERQAEKTKEQPEKSTPKFDKTDT